MDIVIINSSEIPIYQQIMKQIKAAILSGDLKEGDLLPSVRGLARDLNVSLITTRKAYDLLETEGFTVSMAGKGSFVAPKNLELLRENKLAEIERMLEDVLAQARLIDLDKDSVKAMIDELSREDMEKE